MISNNVLITFAVALCFIQFSEAITCYKCTSTTKGCGDKDFNPDAATKQDCSDAKLSLLKNVLAPTSCMKSVVTDNAGQFVTRDCQWIPQNTRIGSTQCIRYEGLNPIPIPCETCSTDLCNSANAKQIATFGVLALLVGVIMKIIN